MIHHVKQKLRLNLNANVVDAIVHLNVKATAVQQTFARQAGMLGPRPTPPSESFLPGPLLTPVSAILHLGHVLSLPGCFPSPGLSVSRLATCLQSSRHWRSLDWSSAQGCADGFSGVHVVPRPGMIVLTELLSHVCRRVTSPCNNSLSPHGFVLCVWVTPFQRKCSDCLLIGCDCGSSRMQS